MDPNPFLPTLSVSNLVPAWEGSGDDDGGGTYDAGDAAGVVGAALRPQVVRPGARASARPTPPAVPPRHPATVTVRPEAPAIARQHAPATPTPMTAPAVAPERALEHPAVRRSPEPVAAVAQRSTIHSQLLLDGEGLPAVDYDLLDRRDIAREVLRARLVAIAEQRHHRSAYEIAFILLAVAVAVLLVAPPLGHILLAARGIEA